MRNYQIELMHNIDDTVVLFTIAGDDLLDAAQRVKRLLLYPDDWLIVTLKAA